MNKTEGKAKTSLSTNLVLEEIWRIKDALSASYSQDGHRPFGLAVS